jgi:hypothetical protein
VGGGALDEAGESVRDWVNAPATDFPFYVRALAIVLPICLIVLSLLAVAGVFGHHWMWAIGVPGGLEALLASSASEENKEDSR